DTRSLETLAASTCDAESAGVRHDRTLEAITDREAILVRLLMVHLDIERVLVLAARGGTRVIIRQVVVDVRQRNEREQLLRDRADSRVRNLIVRKRRAANAR